MSLPKRIFVYEEQGTKGEKYMIACTSESEAADIEKRIVGIYELKKKQKIQLQPVQLSR